MLPFIGLKTPGPRPPTSAVGRRLPNSFGNKSD
jgi:hypothetical protein